jgi:hypothetical protein
VVKQNIRILIYISLIVVGFCVLVWPEEENLMLVQFNESHGPSMLDSIGLALIFAGYLPMVVHVIRNFSTVLSQLGKITTITLVAIVIISGALIAAGLIKHSEPLLWSSVAVCTVAEAVIIFYAYRATNEA